SRRLAAGPGSPRALISCSSNARGAPLLINWGEMAAEENTTGAHALEELPAPSSEDADVEVEREQDAPEPAELDAETPAQRDAALRRVRKLGDPVLRASALPVERFDKTLRAEIERMGELMHDALG